MIIRKTAALLAAVLTVLAAVPAASADYTEDYGAYNGYGDTYGYDNTYDNTYNTADDTSGDTDADTGAVTTAPPAGYDPTKSAGNEVTAPGASTTITTYVADTPTSKPSSIYLVPGQMQDGEVKVNLNMESDYKIANASLSVSFDKELLEFVSSQKNELAGGMAVENCFDGKYVFNYVNKNGSDFDGTYCTLTFKVKDPDMVSTVLYLAVTSFDDEKLNQISFASENGIVRNPNAIEEDPAETTAKVERSLTVPFRDVPTELSELGIENVKACVIDNTDIMLYQNGAVLTLDVGSTKMEIVYEDTTMQTFNVDVVQFEETPTAEEASAVITEEKPEDDSSKKKLRYLFIGILATLAVLVIIIEYLLIIKKPKKKKPKKAAPPKSAEEDNSEMLADLRKAIEAKNARRAAENAAEYSPENELQQTVYGPPEMLGAPEDDGSEKE